MVSSMEKAALLAAFLGVGLHLGYFIRGEHHTSAVRLFLLAVSGPPALCLYFTSIKAWSLFESIRATTILVCALLVPFTTSVLTYRFLFHPLRHYPGPRLARLSKFWQVAQAVAGTETFDLLHQLHATYGNYVRTGPNEISVIDIDVVDAVYGPKSKCWKGPWYDQSLPLTSLQQLRDRSLHDERRRGGWDKAFSIKSLRAYDSSVVGLTDLLLQKLNSFEGRPVNASEWFNYYSYDVMGSLGFGRTFETLETGGSHKFIDVLKAAVVFMKYFGPVSYITSIFAILPASLNPITQMVAYSEKCVEDRKQKKTGNADILGHLIESETFFGNPQLDHSLLVGDSRLVIIAGSDTTAAALAFTFYYIAKDPEVAAKIRIELQENGIRNNDQGFSVPSLNNLTYLNGVINEGLRLHPLVPGGVFRMTPPEGLQIKDRFIPGDVNILVPTFSLQRSPENFVDPEAFVPERWGSKPELIINKTAFMPFSTGAYGCIGKHLAMNELRTVISKVLMEFDVNLAPHEDGVALFRDQRDNFTLHPGKLDLCFVKRDLWR